MNDITVAEAAEKWGIYRKTYTKTMRGKQN